MNDRKDHYIQLQLNEQECMLLADALGVFADCTPFDTRVGQAIDMAQGMYVLAKGMRKLKQEEDRVREIGED